jgi:hypothetical protein
MRGRSARAHAHASQMNGRKPLARSDELVVEELDDELLVYDQKTDRAHCLSSEAARVWRRCDGQTRIDVLSAELHLDSHTVDRALDELAACELLETAAETAGGSTRRELTVKVVRASAAAAAAPLIISVAAPTPAMAATPAFCATFSSGNCGCGAGSSGCCGSIGCCCCTPPLQSPFPAGSPCAVRDPTSQQCKTCVPCDQQGLCQTLYGHRGSGCASGDCPA